MRPVFSRQQNLGRFPLRIGGKSTRAIWFAIFVLTVLDEVYPFPLIPPLPFYTIWCIKLLFFFLLGYFAPYGFWWHFRSLYSGILVAFGCSAFIEGLQAVIGHGHAFHWSELLVKIVLIFLGFILGLGRVDQKLERLAGAAREHQLMDRTIFETMDRPQNSKTAGTNKTR